MDRIPRNYLPFLLISLIIHAVSAAAIDTITSLQSIRDGETLVSSGGTFEFGFFSPGNSTNRYVGIWYNNITVPTYVWVANREAPLTTKSGVLSVTEDGMLALFNETNATIIWSSNASVGNPAAQLLETGNLVVKDAAENLIIWQSFDFPTDTSLPGMMSLGWNLETGEETYISSWRSKDDPSPGNFTLHLDPTGYPQLLFKRGKSIRHRVGPWNGEIFSGTAKGTIYIEMLLMNKNRSVGKYRNAIVSDVVTMLTLRPDGVSQHQILNNRTKSWTTYWNMPSDSCDNYNSCGAYGSCIVGNSPHCGCLERFGPKNVESWEGGDWSDGCVRRIPLNCSDDVFLKYTGIKLPDARNSYIDEQATSLEECEVECSRNCTLWRMHG